MLPYQRYAQIVSALLLGFIVAIFFLPEVEWLLTAAGILAAVVLMAVGLELYRLIRFFQRGELYLVRNLTFYVTLATFILLPALLVSAVIGRGEYFGPISYFLLPVILFFGLQNLYYLHLNSIKLDVKIGPGAPASLPLFDIKQVHMKDDSISVVRDDGKGFELERNYFYPAQWRRLREELSRLKR